MSLHLDDRHHPPRPRTQHIEGSRLQPGDEDLDAVPFDAIAGRHLVVEERMDGANCGISFRPAGELLLQSRGHDLTGAAREKHFTLLKQWATVHTAGLYERLGTRYVLYGEWLYAKHAIFYDALPHYLREVCNRHALDPERVLRETEPSRDMEGLYIKVEEDGIVTGRYKYVRAGFLTAVLAAEWICSTSSSPMSRLRKR